jgi:hypothetical protein
MKNVWATPRFLFNEYHVGFFLGPNWIKHDADHSPPSSAEVQNAWSCNSMPPYTFMACRGIIHFTLSLKELNETKKMFSWAHWFPGWYKRT